MGQEGLLTNSIKNLFSEDASQVIPYYCKKTSQNLDDVYFFLTGYTQAILAGLARKVAQLRAHLSTHLKLF